MPVKTMAMPRSSAAAITSSSRMLPPGWITATAPARRRHPGRRETGKTHPTLPTEPASDKLALFALIAAMRAESTRLICPAPTPSVLPRHRTRWRST